MMSKNFMGYKIVNKGEYIGIASSLVLAEFVEMAFTYAEKHKKLDDNNEEEKPLHIS